MLHILTYNKSYFQMSLDQHLKTQRLIKFYKMWSHLLFKPVSLSSFVFFIRHYVRRLQCRLSGQLTQMK